MKRKDKLLPVYFVDVLMKGGQRSYYRDVVYQFPSGEFLNLTTIDGSLVSFNQSEVALINIYRQHVWNKKRKKVETVSILRSKVKAYNLGFPHYEEKKKKENLEQPAMISVPVGMLSAIPFLILIRTSRGRGRRGGKRGCAWGVGRNLVGVSRGKMDDRFDAHVLIAELTDICFDSLLNKEQKERFIESSVLSALLMLKEDDLAMLRASWRISKDYDQNN